MMFAMALPELQVEDRLLAQALHGDQGAVMRIYEVYFPPIYQFVRLRVHDKDLAQDIVSNVFYKFVVSLRGRNAPRQSLRGWLFKVARNEVNTYYGKNRRFPTTTLEDWVTAPVEHQPEVQFIRALNAERAREAIAVLAPDQQEVLILRFGQMLSVQETADIMNKSVGAVKALQFRAIETLRKILTDLRTEADYA